MKFDELVAQLMGLKDQAEKSKAEIVAKIQSLEDAINGNGDVPENVVAALEDLKASVQAIDDLNPDTTETPGAEIPSEG